MSLKKTLHDFRVAKRSNMIDNKLIMMKATAVKSTYRHTGKVEFQQWLNFIGGLIATSAVCQCVEVLLG